MNQTHIDALNELSKTAFCNAVAKGFHDKDILMDEVDLYGKWTANLHGEVSELWESARNGTLQHYCDKHDELVGLFKDSLTCEEEELADIIIRVLDTAGAHGVNIGRAVLIKMAFNATRPHMHGKLA